MSKVEFIDKILIPDFFHKNEMQFKHLNTNSSENTIKRVSFCLKILVDYCEANNIKLNNFLEDDLINLSRQLQTEKDDKGSRNSTTVNNIIYQIMKFFDFFGKMFLNDENYLKNVLNVEEKSVSKKGQLKIVKKHKAMVLNTEKTTRNPINIQDIDFIYQNIDKIYVSRFAQERTKVLLKLLEHTGARLGELSLIKINDITNAIKNDKGLLQLTTLKRRRETSRFVPVDKEILN